MHGPQTVKPGNRRRRRSPSWLLTTTAAAAAAVDGAGVAGKHNRATATLFRKYAVEQATRSHQFTKAPLAMTKAATRLRRKTWTTSSHKKKKKGRSIRPKTTTTKKKKKRFRFGFESGLSLILCSSPSQRCCCSSRG